MFLWIKSANNNNDDDDDDDDDDDNNNNNSMCLFWTYAGFEGKLCYG